MSQIKSHIQDLSGKEKLQDVQNILKTLEIDQIQKRLSEKERNEKLEQLKVYGRDQKDAGPIFTRETVKLLLHYAFDVESLVVSREALRCLANTFFLQMKLVQTFVDLGYGGKAADRLKGTNNDDEFLICRVLFLSTYGSTLDFAELERKHNLTQSIHSHLARHAQDISSRKNKSAGPAMENMALSETLKLIYNVTSHHPDLVNAFNPCSGPIIKILSHITIPSPPLQPPISFLINALAQLDLDDDHDSSETTADLNAHIDTLVTVLDKATTAHQPSELETLAVPLILLLCKIYAIAPDIIQKHMRTSLLPSPSDRNLPIGQSPSLPSRLLRLTTNPVTTHLRESISGLYFELSSTDPTTFVHNVGYGYAAGYLMSHNIALPPGASPEGSSSDVPVNPITGQRLDREKPVDDGLPEMTEDEKEREAEKLYVLFERLQKTGVVDVRNPVHEAMRRGEGERRFEEVEEDDDD